MTPVDAGGGTVGGGTVGGGTVGGGTVGGGTAGGGTAGGGTVGGGTVGGGTAGGGTAGGGSAGGGTAGGGAIAGGATSGGRAGGVASGGGQAGGLAAIAMRMSPGQWTTITMNGMNAALVDAGNGHSIIEYSARGHWDATRRRMYFWGQGHYSAQKLITWDEASNLWTSSAGGNTGSIGHAYYHQAFDPSSGDLYLRSYGSGAVQRRPPSGGWTAIASTSNLGNQVAGGLEWFAALNGGSGGLVFVDTISVETYAPSTNSWTVRSSTLGGLGPYHQWIAATQDFLYFGGGNGSSAMYRLSPSGIVSGVPNTPTPAGINASIVIAHPNGRELLLFASSGSIHRFDGNSWSPAGSHQIPGQWTASFGVPIADYGIIVFVGQGSSTAEPVVRVYKP